MQAQFAVRTRGSEHARVQKTFSVMIRDQGCKDTHVCKHDLL